MSILINLLPDLKQAKLREHRRRQLVSGISIVIWVISGGIVALLLVYQTGQSVVISGLTHSIANSESQLKNTSNLVNALTAEQELNSLPGLYSQRVYMSKFFASYVAADPATISLSSLTVDSSNDLTVVGEAPSYADVAKLSRAMADYNVTLGSGANTSNTPYFTDVTISQVGEDTQAVSFTIEAVVGEGAESQSTLSSGSSNGN